MMTAMNLVLDDVVGMALHKVMQVMMIRLLEAAR